MKQANISNGGRRRAISLDTLTSLRAVPKLDQLETGTLTVEIEGEEPAVLTLPVAMIEAMLEGIGAGAPAAAPAPEEMMAEEEVAMEAADAGDEEDKLDSKIRAIVSDAFGQERQRVALDSARRTEVNADAATILPPAYTYGPDWAQTCLDAIAKVDPEAEAMAKAIAKRARNGDSVAEGRLRQMLADRRLTADGGLQLTPGTPKPKTDSNPIPPHERPRPTGGDS